MMKTKIRGETVSYVRLSKDEWGNYNDDGKEVYKTYHAFVTVKNKKHTKLTIEKKYKDGSGNIYKINNVGIKVLVKLKEDIIQKEENTLITYNKNSYAWLRSDNGKILLTKNIKQAEEFLTGTDGTKTLESVPYGEYTFYEVTPGEGFSLSIQDGYNGGLPSGNGYNQQINGTIEELGEHVRIKDTTTIQPNEAKNVGEIDTNLVCISGDGYKFYFDGSKDDDKDNEANSILRYLSIENNGRKEGNKVKFYSDNELGSGSGKVNEKARNFYISYAGHGYYRLNHSGTKQFLGITNKSNPANSDICQYGFDSGDNTQLWYFEKIGQKYKIVNKALSSENKIYMARNNKTDNYGQAEVSGALRFYITAPEKNIEPATNGERTVTIEIWNRKNSLQIYKIDKTYKQDLGRENDIYLSAKLAIYARNTGKWLNIDSEGNPSETTKVSYIEITENHTAENPLKIFNLSEGNYDIYEAETPNGYNKTKQDGYMNNNNQDPNAFSLKNKWVYLKSVNIRNNGETVTAPLENIKPSNLTGKVWVDKEEPEKGAQRDNLYGSDTNDELLNGITVNLISHKDGENTRIASTTTKNINNINGTYLFERKDNGDYITYWELAYCHVEFIYDNKNYVVATPFAGDSTEQKANNSKALPNNIITEGGATLNDERTNKGELYDGNLVGAIDAEFGGKARTYIGETSGLRATLIKNNKEQEPNKQQNKLLTAFYNENNYTVENINLGLIEQLKSPMGIEEKLDAVKIIRKDENGGQYEFTYEDDKPFALADSGINQDIVKTENRTYYPYLYPTDIKYNFASDISDEYKNKVYLVYRIRVKNNNTLDYEDIYEEQYFKLTKLTNKFDNTLYEINNEDIGYEKNAAWNITGEGTAEAIVDITLRPQEAWDTYIQFRVKNDSLPDINKDNQNITTATGYHKYTRADRNWEDGNNSNWDWSKVPHREHFTENEEDTSSAIGIEWQHRDARTISGNVFEDHKNESRLNERIGNGKKDDGENGVEGVVVTLIDAQTDRIAKLYDGSLEEGENGKWQSSSSDAVFTVGADGKYELKGVIPGNYYLQFSYGNGNVTYKDLNGNDITKDIETKIDNKSIDSNLYKSTILTENASDTSKNERNWFLNNEEHSIALDSEETINKRIDKDGENIKEELNYSTIRSQEVINAKSPKMNVQFEYIYFDSEENTPKIAYSLEDKNKVYDNNLESDCTGMNFGIIERPKVDIQLDKNIENVKFTLQNSTTIINGNPNDQNVSSSLSSWADKEDEFNSTAKIELDSSLLYGSDISVTYVMVAHNESELDYATENYYKYGIIEDPEDIVKTAVTRIAEYIDNGNAKYQILSNNIIVENLDESIYLTEEAKTVNKNFDKKALVANEEGKLLTPSVKAKDGSDRETYKITVSNLLSNSDTLYGWENYSEIVGIRNKTKTPQSTSHFGSLEIKNPETDEPDDANATIILTSTTGENRDLTIYYIIVGVFILLAIGATFILKKNKHK